MGPKTWLYDNPKDQFNTNNWIEQQAERKTVWNSGTKQKWNKINVPKKSFWSFRDLVRVPSNLSPGDYVLSFRWDAKGTPQIWGNCANVRIVA